MPESPFPDHLKGGFLVPAHFDYEAEINNDADMNTASLFWGFTICAAFFVASTAGVQTVRMWKRHRRVTAYVGMVWGEWLANLAMGSISWTYQRQYFGPSFWFYFAIAFVWVFQVHFLLQIIINRIGLLIHDRRQVTRLKLIVFFIILFINISVFIIWIPARLQISPVWIHANEIWDRVEKVIFCLIDAALNFYFIWLVRTRLIDNGLKKYVPLFRMNLILVSVSIALDVVLVGLMFSKNPLMYLQFHPVVYMSKLAIEMNMAELIVRIVRAANPDGIGYNTSTTDHKPTRSGPTQGGTSGKRDTTLRLGGNTRSGGGAGISTVIEGGAHSDEEDIELDEGPRRTGAQTPAAGAAGASGITVQRTVETKTSTVVESERSFKTDDDALSRSSSTRKLRNPFVVE